MSILLKVCSTPYMHTPLVAVAQPKCSTLRLPPTPARSGSSQCIIPLIKSISPLLLLTPIFQTQATLSHLQAIPSKLPLTKFHTAWSAHPTHTEHVLRTPPAREQARTPATPRPLCILQPTRNVSDFLAHFIGLHIVLALSPAIESTLRDSCSCQVQLSQQ